MQSILGSKLGNLFRRQKHLVPPTRVRRADLEHLASLVGEGALKPVIAATFPYDDTLPSFALVERGGVLGKIVVSK